MSKTLLFKDVHQYVSAKMGGDPRLQYHTYQHSYDVSNNLSMFIDDVTSELRVAALFHDIVYDELGDKVRRSAEVAKSFCENYHGIDAQRVYDLIMVTEDHSIRDHLHDREAIALVKSDLLSLTDPLKTIESHVKITKENMALYGISRTEAEVACRKFILDFKKTVEENFRLTKDRYWLNVYRGCKNTSALAMMVMETDESTSFR